MIRLCVVFMFVVPVLVGLFVGMSASDYPSLRHVGLVVVGAFVHEFLWQVVKLEVIREESDADRDQIVRRRN